MTDPTLIVCYRKCWACNFNVHDSQWHTWADSEDVEWELSSGRPDPRDQKCGCYCCTEAAR